MNIVSVNIEVDHNSFFAVLRDDYIELYNEKHNYLNKNLPKVSYKISEYYFQFERNELLIFSKDSYVLTCKMLFPTHFSLLLWFHNLKIKGRVPKVLQKNKSVNHLNCLTNNSNVQKKVDILNNTSNSNLATFRCKSFKNKNRQFSLKKSLNPIERKYYINNSPSMIKTINENQLLKEELSSIENSESIKIEDNIHKRIPNCFEKKELPYFGNNESVTVRKLFINQPSKSSFPSEFINNDNYGLQNFNEEKLENINKKNIISFDISSSVSTNLLINKYKKIFNNSFINNLGGNKSKHNNHLENTKLVNIKSLAINELKSTENTNSEKECNKFIFHHFNNKCDLNYVLPIKERNQSKNTFKAYYSQERIKKYHNKNLLTNISKLRRLNKNTNNSTSVRYISLRDDIIDSNKKFKTNIDISSSK